jgi:hypothetical protein
MTTRVRGAPAGCGAMAASAQGGASAAGGGEHRACSSSRLARDPDHEDQLRCRCPGCAKRFVRSSALAAHLRDGGICANGCTTEALRELGIQKCVNCNGAYTTAGVGRHMSSCQPSMVSAQSDGVDLAGSDVSPSFSDSEPLHNSIHPSSLSSLVAPSQSAPLSAPQSSPPADSGEGGQDQRASGERSGGSGDARGGERKEQKEQKEGKDEGKEQKDENGNGRERGAGGGGRGSDAAVCRLCRKPVTEQAAALTDCAGKDTRHINVHSTCWLDAIEERECSNVCPTHNVRFHLLGAVVVVDQEIELRCMLCQEAVRLQDAAVTDCPRMPPSPAIHDTIHSACLQEALDKKTMGNKCPIHNVRFHSLGGKAVADQEIHAGQANQEALDADMIAIVNAPLSVAHVGTRVCRLISLSVLTVRLLTTPIVSRSVLSARRMYVLTCAESVKPVPCAKHVLWQRGQLRARVALLRSLLHLPTFPLFHLPLSRCCLLPPTRMLLPLLFLRCVCRSA